MTVHPFDLSLTSPSITPVLPTSVKALIAVAGGVLLLRKASGVWDLPGGKCDPGETQEQTLIREVVEETGLTLREAHYLGWNYRLRDPRPPVPVGFYGVRMACLSAVQLRLSPEHNRSMVADATLMDQLTMPDIYRRAAQMWLAAQG
jgi:8-oxo-dGTP pyrophosphatase MutT (NUDIX family)